MILSLIVTFYMESIADAWKILMALGAGTGLVYILRWFWWRINAWSEISAMTAAFIVSLVLQFCFHFNEADPRDFAYLLLITVVITTIVWLSVTFATGPEPREILLSFYRKVRPNPWMWGPIATEASDVVPQKDGIFNLINWLCGVAMIYALLFGVGKVILGSLLPGIVFIIAGLVFAITIFIRMNKHGWDTMAE
jgi:solute:Na+ symporter, SSS family